MLYLKFEDQSVSFSKLLAMFVAFLIPISIFLIPFLNKKFEVTDLK
jgi:hypothetical protein